MGIVVYGSLLLLFGIRRTRLHCPKRWRAWRNFPRRELLGTVMPLALSFNLAGNNIQLMMGVLFAEQSVRNPLSFRKCCWYFSP